MTDTHRPLPYTDDIETISVDEAEDIQRVIEAMGLILARSQAKTGQFRADVHVKTHGYAEGELRVLPKKATWCWSTNSGARRRISS
jgi:hypothetical protein